jgi:hypothetical protein
MFDNAQSAAGERSTFLRMLHAFLSSHREDLIARCSLKVSQRPSPHASASELQYGIPHVLDQLCAALDDERASPTPQEDALFGYAADTRVSLESGRAAALHGTALFRLGYTVDQVVHDYGDLCQAVTELATEVDQPVTVEEFHTFNRLIDDSIANAVSAYSRHQHSSDFVAGAQVLHERLGSVAEEQRALLDTALKALEALKLGELGLKSATAKLLEESLLELRDLVDRSLPAVRVASGMVTPPPHE